MKTRIVKVGKDIYELTAVTCDVSGAISIDLFSNVAPIIVSFMDGNLDLLNKELRNSINSEKLMRIFIELINVNILKKNNELVRDWKEEFACKPLTLFQLGVEALRFNCEDFFTFISGFAKEKNLGQNWKEIVKSLEKDGVEIPPMFSLLLQNGEQETEQPTQEV
jgi:hypothetical protein